MVALDYAYFIPKAALDNPSFLFAGSIRYSLLESADASIGARGDLGVLLGLDTFVFGVHVSPSLHALFAVAHRLLLGGGLELPLLFGHHAGGPGAFLDLPLLVGPVLEFHLTPPLAATLDFKLGPSFSSESAVGTRFAMKLHVGFAYRL